MTTKFHELNRASEVLAKIGKGAADADFARAIHQAIDRAQDTMKKCKVRVEVEIDPDQERGCLLIRAKVTTRLAELPPPASQMHVGEAGQLLTQQEFLMGGGRDEAPPLQMKPTLPVATETPSGRFTIVPPPAPAPVADLPTPQPVAGKDLAAGKE